MSGSKKNGARRSSTTAKSAGNTVEACLAGPIPAIDATAIDSPKWPLHSSMWLQPDGSPSIAIWSGLAVERQNRLPMPDFQAVCAAVFDHPGERYSSRDTLTCARGPAIPQSDLVPLGWDPRALCPKEGRE